MNVVDMLDAMSKPPLPAPEVVTLDRPIIETILAELEAADPLRAVVTGLRAALAAPKVQLWAMFTPGPNEIYAFAVDSAAEIEALKAEVDQLRQHNAALRQQLADVTNERDGLREGFSHQAKLAAEDQETIESLEGRLDASEARNSEAAELLREASKSIIRHQAEQPMSHRLSGLLTKTRTAINKHLAQAAPATDEQGEAP